LVVLAAAAAATIVWSVGRSCLQEEAMKKKYVTYFKLKEETLSGVDCNFKASLSLTHLMFMNAIGKAIA